MLSDVLDIINTSCLVVFTVVCSWAIIAATIYPNDPPFYRKRRATNDKEREYLDTPL